MRDSGEERGEGKEGAKKGGGGKGWRRRKRVEEEKNEEGKKKIPPMGIKNYVSAKRKGEEKGV